MFSNEFLNQGSELIGIVIAKNNARYVYRLIFTYFAKVDACNMICAQDFESVRELRHYFTFLMTKNLFDISSTMALLLAR